MHRRIIRIILVLTGIITFATIATIPFAYEAGSLGIGQAFKSLIKSAIVLFAVQFLYKYIGGDEIEG